MKFDLKTGVLVFGCLGCVCSFAQAQMFGGESENIAIGTAQTTESASRVQKNTGWWERLPITNATPEKKVNSAETTATQKQDKTQQPKGPPAKIDVTDPENYIYKYVPREKRPTLDGVKRGTTAIYPVSYQGMPRAEDEPLIFLFYSDFSVEKLMSGNVTCNVRFQILTTLNSKLTNLSVRLRWPDMETTVNFIDVPPNQMVHYDYTLIGDGCYSMDKIPNIVVNRCRAKGLSQKDCAAKIRWLRK